MAGIEYYFNNLDFTTFQRLINSILTIRFGENMRLTPLSGSDGGRDGETAPNNPFFEFQVDNVQIPQNRVLLPPQKGRYLFQVKFHSTKNTRLSDVRRTIISEFEGELKKNVLNRQGKQRVNYFFLITNVPSSEKIIAEVDKRTSELRKTFQYLYADIWWEERVKAFLDGMPSLWNTFPDLFAGGKVPFLASITQQNNTGLTRAVRIATDRQYIRDSNIKFRQIGLEKNLSRLFTGLDINAQYLDILDVQSKGDRFLDESISESSLDYYSQHHSISALKLLLSERSKTTRKIILEGGPGQGKSTITQMLTQIYRQQLLSKNDMDPEGRWTPPQKSRYPFRIELRKFAEWLSKKYGESIEEYLAFTIKQDAGGSSVTVDDIHNIVERSCILLILDGLDEVGSDDLRNDVLGKIAEVVYRFENNLNVDLRVIITTRPPAVTNCAEYLTDFERFPIAPMNASRISQYVRRWTSVQLNDEDDKREVQDSFEKRQHEPHVQALAKNPMQLSVLLHFIRLKGVAFPDRRAELYREYFRTVIDRDVEKSSSLLEQRETIEALHQFLGYKIHALTEVEQADGSLTYNQLLRLVEGWLTSRGGTTKTARELFKLGEERLGLIVALKGEGEETRYGYEIQPIREYFAAAFINDDIQGEAHEVFEVMVRQPYWKEVALFLAGLRRPNEKADLIARAKALDENSELGWRQDGRAMILQLLQEGIFSQPPHLFSNALDFLFDALDPKLVNVQNEPKDFLKIFTSLIKGEVKARYINHILHTLHNYRCSEDEYIIYRLYYFACHIMEPEKAQKELLAYEGCNPDLVAKVKFLWPYQWKLIKNKYVQDPSFWDTIPDETWSNVLWHAISHYNESIIFSSLPPRFHMVLLKQFAMEPPFRDASLRGILEPTDSKHGWSVQTLFKFQRLFILFSDIEGLPPSIKEKVYTIINSYDPSLNNPTGLDDSYRTFVDHMIEVSYGVLKGMFISPDQMHNTLDNYSDTVRQYLKQPGLLSWLAFKCALNLLVRIFRKIDKYWDKNSLVALWKELKAFFPKKLFLSEETEEISESEIMLIMHYTMLMTPGIIPGYVRLEDNGELTDLVTIIADYLCEGKELPFEWIKNIPLTTMILPLINKCKKDLPALLKLLNDTHFELFTFKGGSAISSLDINGRFVGTTFNSSLSASDIQRILKVVRNTDDHKILSGALIALSSSKFLRSAGVALTMKMILAASGKASIIINLFDRKSSDKTEADKEIIDKIAQHILETPNLYDFLVVCTAAEYLADYTPVGLPSLLSMEDKLNLHVHTKKST
jgi:NACHT domain